MVLGIGWLPVGLFEKPIVSRVFGAVNDHDLVYLRGDPEILTAKYFTDRTRAALIIVPCMIAGMVVGICAAAVLEAILH
jgi:hypothetical protein